MRIYDLPPRRYASDQIDSLAYGRELINWNCPQCGEKNIDLQDDYTHCAFCGRCVWVLNRDNDIEDQKWSVDL